MFFVVVSFTSMFVLVLFVRCFVVVIEAGAVMFSVYPVIFACAPRNCSSFSILQVQRGHSVYD